MGGTEELSEERNRARVRATTERDLETFRISKMRSPTGMTRAVEIEDLNEVVDTSTLARDLTTLDDLALVSPPGMGKTTTLFQIAKAILEGNYGSPIVVPLGNWSASGISLVDSILTRRTFRTITRDSHSTHLHYTVIHSGGLLYVHRLFWQLQRS